MSATKAPRPSEIHRSADWDTIAASVNELVNCAAAWALVVSEPNLERHQDYAQRLVLHPDYDTRTTAKWQNQKNLLGPEVQARLLALM